jgi:uncharacterized protein (DUF2164 family)
MIFYDILTNQRDQPRTFMAIELTKEEIEKAVPSLRKFFSDELEIELSEMRAKFLLNYFLKEIGPIAYNKGVKDAESFFRGKVEDLTATCFEDAFTYWLKKRT